MTTADFLTSLTNPFERIIRPGFEYTAPRTADDFALSWKLSIDYTSLRMEIADYNLAHLPHGESVRKFTAARRLRQSKYQ